MRFTARLTIIMTLLTLLIACGQKGALYLPQDKPEATAAADQETPADKSKTKQ